MKCMQTRKHWVLTHQEVQRSKSAQTFSRLFLTPNLHCSSCSEFPLAGTLGWTPLRSYHHFNHLRKANPTPRRKGSPASPLWVRKRCGGRPSHQGSSLNRSLLTHGWQCQHFPTAQGQAVVPALLGWGLRHQHLRRCRVHQTLGTLPEFMIKETTEPLQCNLCYWNWRAVTSEDPLYSYTKPKPTGSSNAAVAHLPSSRAKPSGQDCSSWYLSVHQQEDLKAWIQTSICSWDICQITALSAVSSIYKSGICTH